MSKYIFLFLSALLVGTASGQNFGEYGFRASLPCKLEKQKSLTGEQAASMGFEGIVSWTTFKCIDRADSGGGTLFRVTAIDHGSYTGGREEYALQMQEQYDSQGKSTAIVQYLGGEACRSKSITSIRGSEFKNWMLDFSDGEWSYTLQVLNNTGNIQYSFNVIKDGFDLE